jgi:hypothetical protein
MILVVRQYDDLMFNFLLGLILGFFSIVLALFFIYYGIMLAQMFARFRVLRVTVNKIRKVINVYNLEI